MTRNLYIRRALETMIERDTAWSPEFLEELEAAATDRESHVELDKMMRAIKRRSRKGAPQL